MQGQIFHSDDEDLDRVKTFDLFSEPVEVQVLDLVLTPSETRAIDLTTMGAVTDIALFPDNTVSVSFTGTSAGVFDVTDLWMVRGTAITVLSLTNPSSVSSIHVKLVLGG